MGRAGKVEGLKGSALGRWYLAADKGPSYSPCERYRLASQECDCKTVFFASLLPILCPS